MSLDGYMAGLDNGMDWLIFTWWHAVLKDYINAILTSADSAVIVHTLCTSYQFAILDSSVSRAPTCTSHGISQKGFRVWW